MPSLAIPANRRKFTPPQLAKLWGVTPEKIILWVRRGELRAIDACSRRGIRPRFLIDVDAIADFERSRAVGPPPPPAPRRRRTSKWY